MGEEERAGVFPVVNPHTFAWPAAAVLELLENARRERARALLEALIAADRLQRSIDAKPLRGDA